METIKNFKQANQVLTTYIPPVSQMRKAYTLERMQKLMAGLGNPQDKLKIIHIAGTSGKTSTGYYVSAFLKAAGQKVGMTVSPHVDGVNERVQINLKPLAETKFCKELTVFLRLISKIDIKPSYFELLVALAYWHFARAKVDYAVIEVGLGGLLDGTNVINRGDKVCILTDIGFDHTGKLGQTLEAIAAQKAGIIRPYNTVFSYEQEPEVMEVFREVSDQQQAELHEIMPVFPSKLPQNLPLFQRRNWYLAKTVYEWLARRDELPQLSPQQIAETTTTYIPARMEVIPRRSKTIILDGSHNQQKLSTLAKSIKARFPDQPIAIMFSLKKDFRLRGTLEAVIKLSDFLIITAFAKGQDEPRFPVAPTKVARICRELGFTNFQVIEDPVSAYKELLKRPEPILLVTGSFYLLNHVRPIIFKRT